MKLLQKFIGAQKKIPQPLFMECLTLCKKGCTLVTLKKYEIVNKPLTDSVVSRQYKKKKFGFENSGDNNRHSIATFYAGGVMEKRRCQMKVPGRKKGHFNL